MYISKPKKGFVLPVIYAQNQNLFKDEVEFDTSTSIQEEIALRSSEKRDRLFDEDEVFDERISEAETYNDYQSLKGMLIFDELSNETRVSTEVEVDSVGKLVFEEEISENNEKERETEKVLEDNNIQEEKLEEKKE